SCRPPRDTPANTDKVISLNCCMEVAIRANPRSLERGFPVGSRQVAVRTGPLVLEAAGNGPAPLTCRRRDRVRSASSRLAAARWTGRWWKGSIGTAERCRSVELRHRLDQFLGGHGAARS